MRAQPNTSFAIYRVRIHFLSPVHVGSGRTLDPCEYVLQRDGDRAWLVIFDQAAFLAELSDKKRQEFLRLCDRDDYTQVRRFFQREVRPEKYGRWRVAVHPPTFDEIQKNIDNPARMGEIHLFTRDPHTGRPYLPGSSLKGAIRTAVVDRLLDSLSPSEQQHLLDDIQQTDNMARQGVRFEAQVLGHANRDGRPDLYRDPFRQIAVADAPLPPEALRIRKVKLVTRNRQNTGAEDIIIYRDVVEPWCNGEPVVVETELRWHREWLSHVMRHNRLPREIDPETICQACNAFYGERWKKEQKRFPLPSGGLITTLPPESKRGCLLRLGRHSHFECVTVRAPFARPPRRGVGRSRTRVDGRIPLGWIYLEFLDEKS